MLQVGGDADFSDSDLSLGEIRVAEITPLKQGREDVADLFRHAQLPL